MYLLGYIPHLFIYVKAMVQNCSCIHTKCKHSIRKDTSGCQLLTATQYCVRELVNSETILLSHIHTQIITLASEGFQELRTRYVRRNFGHRKLYQCCSWDGSWDFGFSCWGINKFPLLWKFCLGHFYCDWSKKSKRKNAVLYNTKLLGVHMGIWIFLTRLRRAYGLQVALS